MTRYEFFSNVAKGNVTEDVKTYAQGFVEAEDAKKAEKTAANADLIAEIEAVLSEAPTKTFKASEIAEACDITTSKATAMLKKMDCVEIGETRDGSRIVKSYKYISNEKEVA